MRVVARPQVEKGGGRLQRLPTMVQLLGEDAGSMSSPKRRPTRRRRAGGPLLWLVEGGRSGLSSFLAERLKGEALRGDVLVS